MFRLLKHLIVQKARFSNVSKNHYLRTPLVELPASKDFIKLEIRVNGNNIINSNFKIIDSDSAIVTSTYTTQLVPQIKMSDLANSTSVKYISLPTDDNHHSDLVDDIISLSIGCWKKIKSQKSQENNSK